MSITFLLLIKEVAIKMQHVDDVTIIGGGPAGLYFIVAYVDSN
ncbi:hypothetical protein [Lysinibacillus pakistanensis]